MQVKNILSTDDETGDVPNATISQVTRIVFTGDLFRVDDAKSNVLENPSATNVHWMKRLYGELFESILEVQSGTLLLDEQTGPLNRLDIYQMCQLPFSTAGWAQLFHSELVPDVADGVLNLLQDALVVAYELPPCIKLLLDREKIPYIDFTTHPIRFLSDYVFGVRTNIRSLRDSIATQILPEAHIKTHARVMAGRSMRRLSNPALQVPGGAVIFFGQTYTDASLIHNGRHASDIDVEIALIELSELYGKVFYKGHPHRNYSSWIEHVSKRNPRVEKLDRNVYDILGSGQVSLAASLSSGTLFEAQYFGIPTKRFLDNSDRFHNVGEAAGPHQYVPVLPTVLESAFWSAAFAGEDFVASPASPRLADGMLKEALNAKWGK